MTTEFKKPKHTPKPRWIRRRLPSGPEYEQIRSMLKDGKLHTVCQEAQCPNIWECFSCGTATFLILGSRCTRNCTFCAVAHGPDGPPDPAEPSRVADAAAALGLTYVVVTSVTRDDLKTVLEAAPDVLNHNIETVARLYPTVRPQAIYERSLELIRRAGAMGPDIPTKSGMMLGLGETGEEIRRAMADLRSVGCSILTLGQYLQPSKAHLEVARYVPPEEFADWEKEAKELGFEQVASGPLVRSSYHAGDLFEGNGKAGEGT